MERLRAIARISWSPLLPREGSFSNGASIFSCQLQLQFCVSLLCDFSFNTVHHLCDVHWICFSLVLLALSNLSLLCTLVCFSAIHCPAFCDVHCVTALLAIFGLRGLQDVNEYEYCMFALQIALQCRTVFCDALKYTTLHCTVLVTKHNITLHFIVLNCIAQCTTALHYTIKTALRCTAVRNAPTTPLALIINCREIHFNWTVTHCTTLHCTEIHCTEL